jgi:purine nucleosidase
MSYATEPLSTASMHRRRFIALSGGAGAALAFQRPAWAESRNPNRRAPTIPAVGQKMRVVIDTDAACEIDDQHAIALAILSPERFAIEGFVATHFGDAGGPEGVQKSYDEILRVLDRAAMAGKFPVKKGSLPMRFSQTPEPSEGADFIIERAMAGDAASPLWVIALGACTNVVSAFLKKPEIRDRINLFWHGRTRWPEQAWNFNAYNDIKAVHALFKSDLPLALFDTGSQLVQTTAESQKKTAPHGPLGRYLHEVTATYIKDKKIPSKGVFDLGDISFLIDPSIGKSEVVQAPGVALDLKYQWQNGRGPFGKILRIYDVDRDATFNMLYERLARHARAGTRRG